MKKDERSQQIKIGVFLLIGVSVLIGVIVLLGRSESLFARHVQLKASFNNIGGLVVGAPVRLAGINIGIVSDIRFSHDLKIKLVRVILTVEKQYMNRIREDSVARLDSNGLLGDMLINISVGSADTPALKDHMSIRAQESLGLNEMAASLQEGIAGVRTLTTDVDQRLRLVLTPELARDLERMARSSANLIEKIEKGQGLLHAITYDARLTHEVTELVSNGEKDAAALNEAIVRASHIIAAVERGGTLHGLIYNDDGTRLVRDLQRTAAELSGVVAEIQHGGGMVHSLIYDRDQGNIIENLASVSRNLKQLADEAAQGKGTVGGLLKDPTIYEDLKTTLDNVQRNALLKALIRYSIKKDNLTRPQVQGGP